MPCAGRGIEYVDGGGSSGTRPVLYLHGWVEVGILKSMACPRERGGKKRNVNGLLIYGFLCLQLDCLGACWEPGGE